MHTSNRKDSDVMFLYTSVPALYHIAIKQAHQISVFTLQLWLAYCTSYELQFRNTCKTARTHLSLKQETNCPWPPRKAVVLAGQDTHYALNVKLNC